MYFTYCEYPQCHILTDFLLDYNEAVATVYTYKG